MNHQAQVVTVLKRLLKAKGLTYRSLANELGLSEASVKRIFSQKSFTFDRLESICEVLGVTIFQLFRSAEAIHPPGAAFFTEAQESVLANDRELFGFFYRKLSQRSDSAFRKLKPVEERMFLKLDRVKLVELYPEGRYRFLVSRNVRWLPQGPLMQRWGAELQEEFLDSSFAGEKELKRLVFAKLTSASVIRLEKKVQTLLQEFEALNQLDEPLPSRELTDMGLVVCFRPWKFSKI